ncbi:hypothetical protein A6D94_18310 [Vibrio splendidus]|nr:hypothetical protein A6D94_18310 [Vibrio splendidus]
MLIGFVAVVILSKYLTVSEFGISTWWLLIATIFGVFFDFGYTVYLSKEVKENNFDHLSKSLSVKFRLIIVCVIIILSMLLYKQEPLYPVLLISAFGFNSLCSSFVVILRVNNKFDVESILVFFNNLFILIIMLFCLEFDFGLYALPVSYFIAKLCYLSYFMFEYRNLINLNWRYFGFVQELKRVSPFFLHAFFGYLYLNVDGAMMPLYVSPQDVGYYQAASKLFFGMLLFSEIISSVLLPRISKIGLSKAISNGYISKYNVLIISLSLLSVMIVFFCKEIIVVNFFSPEYTDSIQYFELLLIVVLLRYIGLIYGLVITLSGYQSFRTISTLITLVIMVILCFILMPIYGVVGGISALILSHVIINVFYIVFCYCKFKRIFILC